MPFVDTVSEISCKREYRGSRHAVQERRIEGLRDDLVVADQQEVRGAGLLYIAVRAEQHLVDTVFFLRGQRRPERRRIVAAGLGAAELLGGSREGVGDEQLERPGTAGEVIADR